MKLIALAISLMFLAMILIFQSVYSFPDGDSFPVPTDFVKPTRSPTDTPQAIIDTATPVVEDTPTQPIPTKRVDKDPDPTQTATVIYPWWITKTPTPSTDECNLCELLYGILHAQQTQAAAQATMVAP